MINYSELLSKIGKNNIFMDVNKNNVSYKIINNYLPQEFSKRSVIEIYGDVDSGKTLLAKEICKTNDDKLFLYIDTYNTYDSSNLFENMYLMQTNYIEEIIEFLAKIDKDLIDCIVIDAVSNLTSKDETFYSEDRYIFFLEIVNKLIAKAYEKNITLIFINTLNGIGKSYNSSYQYEQLISLKIKITETNMYKKNNNFYLNIKTKVEKSKFKSINEVNYEYIIFGGN